MTSFFVVFLGLAVVVAAVEGVQHGTHRIGRTTPDNYYCDTITFPTAFTGIESVKVFTSASFGTSSSHVHDVVFTWVEAVTTSNFKVCLVEVGAGSNGNVTVNWMAYQGIEFGVTDGSVRFTDWTTGTQCHRIVLSQAYPSLPHVFVTSHHNVLDRKQDAATVWVEGITRNEFTVCMREGKNFDGRHKDIDVTWMAMTEIPQTWNYRDFISLDFPNTAQPTEADNDAFCQVVNFHELYYSPATIVLTASHLYDSSSANAVQPEHNSITAWVEETTETHFKSCVKDLVGLNNKHHPIKVEYIAFGDLDPCINKTCEYFGVCQAMSVQVSQCVCITQCPVYEDLVCASNGRTFDNMCTLKQEICQTQGNYSYYHPGGCQGFPLDKGRHHLKHVSSIAESHCEVISLKPYMFYPDKHVHVQLTVNYINAAVPSTVHDATVTWSENVNKDNFTVCMTKTGRNDQQTNDVASVDWIAYQGSPDGGVTGKEKITEWWTGTKCTTLSFPSGKFTRTPTVLVTLEHQRYGLKHDAASVWVEDVSSASFQVCIRELQNFDGIHEEIHVDWMAFETLHRPLFSEHGSVHFANDQTPLKSNNYAFCQDISMTRNYTKIPSVLITATHDTIVGQIDPKYNGISAWIEDVTMDTFRVCLKELYSDRYDPVTVQYVVVSDICGDDWMYFNGFCYKTNTSCLSWQAAQSICVADNANLTSTTSQEENTYVQHRHGGETGWIGLQDMDSEGNFTWIDGSVVNFTYWAENQPNNYPGDQDCVHTLGLRHDYHWNDVTCGSCHAYTCKRDIDECSSGVHVCDSNAQCTNTIGSYFCDARFALLGSFTASGAGRFGSIQSFLITVSGLYLIRAGGASGGTHSYNYGYLPGTYYGGKGATIEGKFQLRATTTLNIVVGQRGGNSVEVQDGESTTLTAAQLGKSIEDNAGTGGGGGSFVYTTDNTLLMVAGGGGGASSGYHGVDGQAGMSGTASRGSDASNSRGGGTNGNPGICNSAGASFHGGVGAGWLAQGCVRAGSEHGERGGSRIQGWVGGQAGAMNSGLNGGPSPGAVGGFGGGGGGSEDNGASGGGGGYSGGGSGTHEQQAGGGGGSYCSGSSSNGTTGGNRNDNGFVEIYFLSV